MSISTSADHRSSPRRVQPRHVVDALLFAVGLIVSVAAIAIAGTTSNASRQIASPATINQTQSYPTAQPRRAPVSGAPGATFRDPATHKLLTVHTPTARRADSGLGHRTGP
jgi:hypothetical protein